MNILELKRKIISFEETYAHLIAPSRNDLIQFQDKFISQVCFTFFIREKYLNQKGMPEAELKAFFDSNTSELNDLSQKAFALFNKVNTRIEAYDSMHTPPIISATLLPEKSIFSSPSNSDNTITSQAIYIATMRQSKPDHNISLDTILNEYKTSDVNHALRRAAYQGNVEHVEILLIDFHADVNSKSNSNGFTALDWAFFNDQMKPYGVFNTLCYFKAEQSILKPLLEKYTKDNETEFPNKTLALARAMRLGNEDDIHILTKTYLASESKARDTIELEEHHDSSSMRILNT